MRSYILIVVIMLLLGTPFIARGEEVSLNVLYTGGLSGELEPCGCSPKTDFGGIARLSGFISQNAEMLSPYILVDAGNFTNENTPQGRLKAEAMIRAFSKMKYDAVAIMKNEKIFPDKFVSRLLKESSTPALCDRSDSRRSLAIKREGIDLNISVDPGSLQEGMLNILLSNLPVSVAQLFDGWDVIITSSGEVIEEPVEQNGTIITAGRPKGKELGILSLRSTKAGNIIGFDHKWQPMGNDIRVDIKVREVMDDYDTKVAGLLKNAGTPPAGTTYSGVKKCAECHGLFEESWKETRHAGAFASLEHSGKTADPECLACHTLGFGEEGGFFTIETTPELANVQCEACHGLDREHMDDFTRPMRPVTAKVCVKCHTKENSPDFDYPVYLERIRH